MHRPQKLVYFFISNVNNENKKPPSLRVVFVYLVWERDRCTWRALYAEGVNDKAHDTEY
jgi:hypothetical protein